MRSADPNVRRPPQVTKMMRTQFDFEPSRSAARASATLAGAGSGTALAGGMLVDSTFADAAFGGEIVSDGAVGVLADRTLADAVFAGGVVADAAVAAGVLAAGPTTDGTVTDELWLDGSGWAASALAANPPSPAPAAAARPGSATWTNGSSAALSASG